MSDDQEPTITQLPRAAAPEPGIESEGYRLRASAGVVVLVAVLTAVALHPAQWGATEVTIFVLLGLTLFTSSLLVFQVAQLLVDEPLSEVIRALLGQQLGVRSGSRFLNRLEHECSDGQLRARNRGFSLAVIGIPQAGSDTDNGERASRLRTTVRSRIRARDVLGELANGEIWVLALGAGADAAEAFTTRIAAALSNAMNPGDDAARIGWSTFETDASTPKELIAVARQRAQLTAADDEMDQTRAA